MFVFVYFSRNSKKDKLPLLFLVLINLSLDLFNQRGDIYNDIFVEWPSSCIFCQACLGIPLCDVLDLTCTLLVLLVQTQSLNISRTS